MGPILAAVGSATLGPLGDGGAHEFEKHCSRETLRKVHKHPSSPDSNSKNWRRSKIPIISRR